MEATHSVAHNLKGSSLSLGASDLAELLAVLETAGKAQDQATLASQGPKLVSVFAQTEQAMNHFLQDEISTAVR